MKLPLIFRPQAVKELEHAVEFYEAQRAGMGMRLAAEVRDVLARLQQRPLIHHVIVRDIRKAALHQFPFCVYYRLLKNRLIVLAIFHTSRDPDIWQRRR